jgi:site-specific recombinase XerD
VVRARIPDIGSIRRLVMSDHYGRAVAWQVDDFERSLTGVSANTSTAYRRDVEGFVTWAARAGIDRPSAVDRVVLRRYLAYLSTRELAPRSIARKAAALRRYFGWLRHVGAIEADPSRALSAPKGAARLPRVLGSTELAALLDEPPARVDDDPVPIRLRDDAVLEVLYG